MKAYEMTKAEFIEAHENRFVHEKGKRILLGVSSPDGKTVYRLKANETKGGKLLKPQVEILGRIHYEIIKGMLRTLANARLPNATPMEKNFAKKGIPPKVLKDYPNLSAKGAQAMSNTIKERLGKQRTIVVAALMDNSQPETYISLTLAPDTSESGVYSVVAKSKGKSEAFRMQYKSSMTVKAAMKHFESYMNTDNKGRFKVIVLETKPPPEVKPKTKVDDWKAKIRQYKKQRYLTATQEYEIEHLQKLIKADPSKFKISDGVKWHAVKGQWNRGYRIVDLDPVNKMAEIASVADTGITITGGKDKLPNQAVPIGDLMRDKKYDAKPMIIVEELPKPKVTKARKPRKTKPLPPDAISPQVIQLNSKEATCYGKRDKRGNFRSYCRVKKD